MFRVDEEHRIRLREVGNAPRTGGSLDIDSFEWSGGEQCLEAWKRRISEVRAKQGARRDFTPRIAQYGGDASLVRTFT